MHSFAWGGGSPFREDLEQRRLSPMGSVDLSTRSMLTGSSVGVVVRNNTDESIEAEVRVAYTSLGGWCEVTDQNELEGVMDKTNALIDALRWRKNTSSGDGAPS